MPSGFVSIVRSERPRVAWDAVQQLDKVAALPGVRLD